MTMRTPDPLKTARHSSSRIMRLRCKSAITSVAIITTLTACAGGGNVSREGPYIGGGGGFSAERQTPLDVVMFAPLSGRDQRIGVQMVNAAKLALPNTGPIKLTIKDEARLGDTDDLSMSGASQGRKLQLGPLRASHATQLKMTEGLFAAPTLAFTSDDTAAGSNLWVMGVTPLQQVAQLVDTARKRENHQKFAAFLPDSALGHALGDALLSSCQKQGLEAPKLVYHDADLSDVKSKLADLLKSGPQKVEATTPATQNLDAAAEPDAVDPTGFVEKDATVKTPNEQISSPGEGAGFDALLLGDTGLALQTDIDTLSQSAVDRTRLRVLGPALWRGFASKLGKLGGAWFAAPDPAFRLDFVTKYRARYGVEPSVLADVAYDTAALARAMLKSGNALEIASLTRPTGFAGVDGIFALNPDGTVRRGLAVFEVLPNGGVKMAYPAPRRFSGTIEDTETDKLRPAS